MKRKLPLLSLIFLVLLASCHISNDVTNGRQIQKRKYTGGFYFNFGKNVNGHCDDVAAVKTALDEGMTEPAAPIATVQDEALTGPGEITLEVPAETPLFDPLSIEAEEQVNTDHSIAQPADLTQHEKGSAATTIGRVYKKHSIPTVVSAARHAADSTLMLILLVILCFLLPPLAVWFVDGVGQRFWIDFIFWLLGWAIGGWIFKSGLAGICTIIAVVYALLIVLGAI